MEQGERKQKRVNKILWYALPQGIATIVTFWIILLLSQLEALRHLHVRVQAFVLFVPFLVLWSVFFIIAQLLQIVFWVYVLRLPFPFKEDILASRSEANGREKTT